MRYIVFDIETQNFFHDTGTNNPADLDISVACAYDSKTDAYTIAVVDEIEKLWPVFESADVIVGYNSDHFDIPILNKYYPGDLSEMKSIDLLLDIKESLGRRIRLDSVAQATLGAKKGGGAGGVATRWWREGKIDEIKKYCKQDVKLTKEIFEYALEHQKLLYKDGAKKHEIPIDISAWKPHEEIAITHSLPF